MVVHTDGAKITKWITREEWDSEKPQYDSMDLVEIESDKPYLGIFNYNHWAIHIGDGFIAHVTTRDAFALSGRSLGGSVAVSQYSPSLKQYEDLAKYASLGLLLLQKNFIEPSPLDNVDPKSRYLYFVRVDHILTVVGNRRFRVHNTNMPGGAYVMRKVEEFYELVRNLNNRPFQYSTFFSNCEHFATGLKYKKQATDRIRRKHDWVISACCKSQARQGAVLVFIGITVCLTGIIWTSIVFAPIERAKYQHSFRTLGGPFLISIGVGLSLMGTLFFEKPKKKEPAS